MSKPDIEAHTQGMTNLQADQENQRVG